MAIDSTVMHNYRFSVGFLKSLLEGLDENKLTHQPSPGMNHPIWIVGHLAMTMEFVAMLAGADYKGPEGWEALFGYKSVPVDDAAKYPKLGATVAELDKAIAAVEPSLAAMTDEALAAQMPNEGFREMMPTVGDGMTFLLNGHINVHTGQLSAWRRAIGLPPLF